MGLFSLARAIDRLFTYYAVGFLGLFLYLTFQSGYTPTSVLLFVLLFPVLLYFFLVLWKFSFGIGSKRHAQWSFSWKRFFLQDNLMFLASVALFTIAVSLAFIRVTGSFFDELRAQTEAHQFQSNQEQRDQVVQSELP